MIHTVDILNITDRNKCCECSNFIVQNSLFGMNLARGGATHSSSSRVPVWAYLAALPCKFPESFSVEATTAGAVAGVWACVPNAVKTLRTCLLKSKKILAR